MSDLTLLVWSEHLNVTGFLVSICKGVGFILMSAGLVFWLCRREYRTATRAAALLHAVVEGTTDAVYVKDCDGRHLLVNEAAARFLGRPVAEVIGRGAHELFEADDAEQLIASDRAIMAGGKVVTLEETLASNGVSRTYHATKAPYWDANGTVIGLVGISRDITEGKRAQAALCESEKRFRQMTDAIPQIVWTAGADGAVTYVNAENAKYTGLETSDMTSWLWERVIHPDDLAHASAQWALTLGDGVPRPVEMRIRRADGVYRWHICRQRPIRSTAGEIVSWVGTNTDIDDLKQTETVLRATEVRLREAQRIARLGSWSWEPPTDKVWWSDAEFELFGTDPAAVRPSFEAFLALLHPEDRSLALDRVEAMRAGADEFANNLRIIRPDGEVIWIHSRARATRDTAGKVVRVEGTDQDITARRLAEIAASESERRLRLALEAAGAIAFTWDVRSDTVTRYFSREPALPATAERLSTLAEVRTHVHRDDLSDFDARLAACLANGVEYRNEYRVVRPDGVTASLDEYGYLDRAGDGSPLRLTGMSIDVTERVAAIDALRVSEERFQEAARVAGFGVFEHDHQSGYFFWSPRLREIYGYDADAPVDLNAYLAMIHPADRDAIAAAIQKAHDPAGDGRFDVEHRLVRPLDGRVLWLTTQSKTRFAGEGSQRRPVRTVGATVDVTAAHEAAEALRNSEERYRLLVDFLPDALFVEVGGKITYCNPSLVRLLGATGADELLGLSSLDITHADHHEEILAQANAAIAEGGEPLAAEIRLVRRDGRSVTVFAVARRITESGQPAILVVLSDRTERERSAALLRSVLGSVGDAILTIDACGTVTSANRATESLFGYAESELLGGNVNILMPEPHRGDHDRYVADYLRTGVAKLIGIGREVEGRRKDGATFPIELTVTEFSRDGERHFTGVVRDITGRRRLEEQFRQAQKMEAVGRLAGGVAHDFNNLLTVINGHSSLLLDKLQVDDPTRGSLAAVLDAGERAARLTQQMLAFSRKSVVKPQLVDLNDHVTESAKLLSRLIGEDIALVVLVESFPARVMIDPGQLEQVLMNLAVNARDAMPTGGQLKIETQVVELGSVSNYSQLNLRPGRYASLRVTDTGCGMSAEVRDKIFEPFFTTKGVSKGTGLGLAVVYGVVQQSGGGIDVTSTVGVGTTFTVMLPVETDVAFEAASHAVAVDRGGSELVLLVEDEDAVRAFVRMALEAEGYTVLTASNGKDALDLLSANQGQVDILVTDVIMPGISGRELAAMARTTVPGLRVLYMSGYTDDALVRHGLHGAAVQFIQKPFSPLDLVWKVRSILDQSEGETRPA